MEKVELKDQIEKKQYHAPQLTEWGPLVKITRGELGTALDVDTEGVEES
jgi:hypothetical protein